MVFNYIKLHAKVGASPRSPHRSASKTKASSNLERNVPTLADAMCKLCDKQLTDYDEKQGNKHAESRYGVE
jgi:hypothetical protein